MCSGYRLLVQGWKFIRWRSIKDRPYHSTCHGVHCYQSRWSHYGLNQKRYFKRFVIQRQPSINSIGRWNPCQIYEKMDSSKFHVGCCRFSYINAKRIILQKINRHYAHSRNPTSTNARPSWRHDWNPIHFHRLRSQNWRRLMVFVEKESSNHRYRPTKGHRCWRHHPHRWYFETSRDIVFMVILT